MFPFVSLVNQQDPQQWWQTGVVIFEALLLFQPTPGAKGAEWASVGNRIKDSSQVPSGLYVQLFAEPRAPSGSTFRDGIWKIGAKEIAKNQHEERRQPLFFLHPVEWETVKIRHLPDHCRPMFRGGRRCHKGGRYLETILGRSDMKAQINWKLWNYRPWSWHTLNFFSLICQQRSDS